MAIKVRIIREAKKEANEEMKCWKGYAPGAQSGKKTKISPKTGERVNNCEEIVEEEGKSIEEIIDEIVEEIIQEIDKDRMKCNKPRYLKKGEPGYGKKQKVVKACDPNSDKEKIQKFGDAGMENKSDSKSNKKSFRARHNCSDKTLEKDWDTAGYWSCKDW